MKKGQKAKKKTPLLQSRVGKYFMLTSKGVSKKEAQIRAGYPNSGHATQIERTGDYRALQEHFGTNLQKHITVNEINSYLADNIRQEGQERVDRNARNKAIELAKSFIEPEGGKSDDSESKVLIVLSK
jgi:hypothetical protein